MHKKIIIFGVIIILTMITLVGCEEKSTSVQKNPKDIFFDSDVLMLVGSSLDIREDRGTIIFVEVSLYFKNLLDKTINVEYAVEFCDKNDKVLYSKPYKIRNLPAGYRELSPDVFSYDGENVADFDHINIHVVDYEVIG